MQDLFSTRIQTRFFIQRNYHYWFDEYNSSLPIGDKNNTGYLLLKQYPENILHNSDLLNFIPYELDLTYPPFCDTTILTYGIELPPYGKKIGFNLFGYEYFKIPYVIDTIPNSPARRQVPA